MKVVNGAIETFYRQQVLKKNITDNLKTNLRTPHFYIAPKVHKKDVPGRLVVISIDCHTSKLSEFGDHCLQPHAKALPSYVKDNNRSHKQT